MFSSEYVEIGEAKKILSIANLKNKIRDLYYAREDARREKASWEEYKENFVKNLLEKSKREGHREGIAEGEERGIALGREQGSHSKAVETARSMIADNFPDSTIAKHTGLSLEEIQKLK